MKVWLALAGLASVVGAQYSERGYDRVPTQYRVDEPSQNSDNDHVSSGISPLVALPPNLPLVVSPSHSLPHSLLVSTGGDALSTHVQHEQYDTNPQYSYSYGVHNPNNGDVKGHSETRQGDVVSGSYSVMEADGSMRIVDYTADPIHGFNAVVRSSSTPVHGQVNVGNSIPQLNNVVYPQRTQPVYLYRQSSIYPSSSVNAHNQQLEYAPSAQLVSPTNEISYVITYRTPSSGNSPQYTLEQSNNAFTLQQSLDASNTQTHSNAQNNRIPSQRNQNQQGSYYHFRMSSNSQQSTQNQPTNSQLVLHQPQLTYNDQQQNTDRSSMANRQSSTNNQNLFGHHSFTNQRNMNNNQRSSSNADYLRSHPTVTAYPTVTPTYHH